MVDKAKIAAIVFGVLGLIFYIGALVTPWFIVTASYKIQSVDFTCTQTKIFFWSEFDCSNSGDKTINGTLYDTCTCSYYDSKSWRKLCRDSSGDNGCSELTQCFDITGALVGVSFGLFVLGFVGVIVINVAGKLEYKATWIPVGLYSTALVVLIVPIVYYPIVFPHAYDKAAGCALYSKNEDITPCDVYSGSSSVDESGTTESLTWGSAGWVLAVLSLFFNAINLLQAYRGRRRDVIVPNY